MRKGKTKNTKRAIWLKQRGIPIFLSLSLLFAPFTQLYAEPDAPPSAAYEAANRSTSAILVDNQRTEMSAYNINGYNYFKLRDIAVSLSDTQKQFDIQWDGGDNVIYLITGRPYSLIAAESNDGVGAQPVSARLSADVTVRVDDAPIAIEMYEVGGYNYFKLRDLGAALSFSVDYDEAGDSVLISTRDDRQAAGQSGSPPAKTPTDAVSLAYTAPFADYEQYVYSGTPSVPDYSIRAGLANVENFLQFSPDNHDWSTSFGYWHSQNELSDAAIQLIEQNGFAVSDKYSHNEFFQIYESNRYQFVPSFITTDSATHTFHLMFDYVLKDLEQNKLHGILIQLSRGMAETSYAQYKELKGTSFETAALRNAAFFSVGSKLLDGGFAVPSEVADVVSQELALIERQAGVERSPVMNFGGANDGSDASRTDYSQYITRSHYNQTKQLQAYFKAMMWYGQITFRSSNQDEVKSALLQTSALSSDAALSKLWQDIFEPTNFFVGECDDITYYQYADALKDLYGASLRSTAEIADESRFAKAWTIIRQMPPPKINSVPIDETQDRDTAISGYRFMGQRVTLDAYVFQNLIDRAVTDRMLPNSLDIPAAFGSETALALLSGDTAVYPEYPKQMAKLRTEISEIPQSIWTSNLYWSWMYMLRPYADATDGAGYPMFMRNSAWTRKELNSFQGSWTELKHDTLLYAKAAMAEMGGEPEPPERPDDRGYVEPNPVVFGRLAALVKQTKAGLQKRGILTAEADEALGVLYELSARLTKIAERELANAPLSDDDYEFIRTYGGELEHIWDTAKHYELSQTVDEWSGEVVGDNMASALTEYYLNQHPCGVIADVATDPNGSALEEATGYAKTIFVVFPRDGKLVLGSGAVFSQYEFTVPMSGRVTDEQWHERMRRNDLPELAQWKRSFMCDIGQTRYSN